MTSRTDVAILGAGQSGLALSHYLARDGVDHVVLDRGAVGGRWLTARWPSLRLLTPNWMNALPDWTYSRANPEGFDTGHRFARDLQRYARAFDAPVVTGAEVFALSRPGSLYRIETTAGAWSARAVVIATGACDQPAVPDWAIELPDHVHQLTPDHYRSPDLLPVGGVLVVGASSTGVQLAREIHRSGRPVTLATGRHVRAPRRYRGRDIMAWLCESGFLTEGRSHGVPTSRLMSQPSLQLAGGRTDGAIGLQSLAAEGVRITGRAMGCHGGRVILANTLATECAAAERRRRKLLSVIDGHIRATAPGVPEEPEAWDAPAALPEPPTELDLRAAGIRTVVWATGYRRTYPWLHLPVLDEAGEILNAGGITSQPGLFVMGLPFMRHRASAFIMGAGRDAAALQPAIHAHLRSRSKSAA